MLFGGSKVALECNYLLIITQKRYGNQTQVTMTDLYRFLSLHVWGNLPASWQRAISQLYAGIYSQPCTRHVISACSQVHYKDPSYLDLFSPAIGAPTYRHLTCIGAIAIELI